MKMACILCHQGIQLILAYSWARPAILVEGKGRRGMFLFLLFLHFHYYSSFFFVPLFNLFYLFSPFLWETTQNDPQRLTCRLTITQSIFYSTLWLCRAEENQISIYTVPPTCNINPLKYFEMCARDSPVQVSIYH